MQTKKMLTLDTTLWYELSTQKNSSVDGECVMRTSGELLVSLFKKYPWEGLTVMKRRPV